MAGRVDPCLCLRRGVVRDGRRQEAAVDERLLFAAVLGGGRGVDVPGDVVALVSLNALGVLAVARRLALERATHQVVVELRNLQGIIPICSYCRKVRSEVGDWQQLERYVHDHSDSAFSHGICPECMQEHHKEFV